MNVTICVLISDQLRRFVFVETGTRPDGSWKIDVDTGCFDREERRHMIAMPRWAGVNHFRPFSVEMDESDVFPGEALYVGEYAVVASPDDPRVRSVEYRIDLDPKNDLERVAVDAYLAIMGIGDRESAPTPVDAARALVRLDAQNRAEAFRQFRRAMVDHARSVLDSNRLSDRMLSAFLREAVQRWDDTPR